MSNQLSVNTVESKKKNVNNIITNHGWDVRRQTQCERKVLEKETQNFI